MRKKYINIVDQIYQECKKHNFADEIKDLEETKYDMTQFSVKIMFTGGFSAGKSSAINIYLEDDVLTENQTPETAIACELLYDIDEYYEAIKDDKSIRFELYEASKINPTEYDYVIRHINNENVKKLDGFTIVDMPGFNSGIVAHNKAILRYAGKGNAYVLVIDCEEGEIKKSLSEFMCEIKNYDNNIAILITKADKKEVSSLKEISENILDSAYDIFGEEVRIETVSKYVNDSNKKIGDILSSFNSDDIFKQTYYSTIFEIGTRCINGLNSMKKAYKLDDSEISKEIQIRLENKKRLEEEFEKEKKRLANKMRNNVRPQILSDAKSALYLQSDEIASSLLNGGGNLSMIVNNILRPVLTSSTRKYVEQSFEELVSNIEPVIAFETSYDNQTIDTDEIRNKMENANKVINVIVDKAQNMNGVYKAITTTLAVTTTAVAPWLELVLIFLPDIIKGVSRWLGQNNERNAQEQAKIQVKNKVANEIIPSIISKLEPEIDYSLDEMQSEMIDDMADSFKMRIDLEIECLEKAKGEMKQNKIEYNNKVAEIEKSINVIDTAISML